MRRPKRGEIFLIIAAITLVLGSLYLPFYGSFEGYEVFLTITTFLYSILAGFSIATTWEEYRSSTAAISKEISANKNLYSLIGSINKKKQKEFGEMLDKYIVLALTTSWEKLSQLNKLYRRIVNFVKDIKIKGKKDEIIYEKILEALSEWAESKNEQLYLGYKRIPVYQWLTLTALAGLLIMFLFIIRTNDIISIVTTVVFSFSIILSLTLIHDLDTYNFAYDSMEEPSQIMFDMMGKKRFYWEEDIKMGIVSPPKGIKYRTRVPREYLKELK